MKDYAARQKSLFKPPGAYCSFHLNQHAPAPKLKPYTSLLIHQSSRITVQTVLWKQSFRTSSDPDVRLGGSPDSNVCIRLHALDFFSCIGEMQYSIKKKKITDSSCSLISVLWFITPWTTFLVSLKNSGMAGPQQIWKLRSQFRSFVLFHTYAQKNNKPRSLRSVYNPATGSS